MPVLWRCTRTPAGEIEVMHLNNLTLDEAVAFGTKGRRVDRFTRVIDLVSRQTRVAARRRWQAVAGLQCPALL
jgi:hypothetical protein